MLDNYPSDNLSLENTQIKVGYTVGSFIPNLKHWLDMLYLSISEQIVDIVLSCSTLLY